MKTKCILASFGFNAPLTKEKLQPLFTAEDLKKEVWIIPYAAYNEAKALEREVQGLTDFGFKYENIKLFEKGVNATEGYIYVPGGDPFKLLRRIQEEQIVEDIVFCVTNGVTYIGVSAGADIACQDIEYVKAYADNNVIDDGDFKALGLIPYNVICHYDHYSFSILRKVMTLSSVKEISNNPIITLRDDQVVLIQDDNWEYVE